MHVAAGVQHAGLLGPPAAPLDDAEPDARPLAQATRLVCGCTLTFLKGRLSTTSLQPPPVIEPAPAPRRRRKPVSAPKPIGQALPRSSVPVGRATR